MTKKNILIVDDEKNILNSLEAIFLDEGFSVQKAGNGLNALDIVSKHAPELVLLDIWIPGKDGIEVLKEIKSGFPDIEVIIMSGHGSIETAVKAVKLGAFDFIEKPLSLEKVLMTINRAFKKYNISQKHNGSKKKSKKSRTNKKADSIKAPTIEASRNIFKSNNLNNSVENESQYSIKEREQAWEKEFIIERLEKNAWNSDKVALELGITLNHFNQKLKHHNIRICKPGKKKEKNQRTLQRSVVLCGQGLHSGLKTGLILSPMQPNSGIVFEDISTGETVKAHIDFVKSTEYATTLQKKYTTIKTIEHIMAVLHMYRITNLLIKIGDEVPIMDGSARDFCELIEDGGIEEQMINLEEIIIDREYCLTNGKKSISIAPAKRFEVKYCFQSEGPGKEQEFYYSYKGKESFKNEIAPARTFGFLKDMEKLEDMGLASGGRLSNVILLDNEKVINTSLRFPDELARHKILDIIGDFYLLGKPVKGRITAHMTGHADNINLMKEIQKHLMS